MSERSWQAEPARSPAAAADAAGDADVIVVGLGPGGVFVADRLARAGLSVIGVEAHLVGGECPYYGCIPSKLMIRAGDALAEARRVPRLAGEASVRPDFGIVARHIRDDATSAWSDRSAADALTSVGVRLVRGRGRLVGPRTVRVGEDDLRASRAVVLNTGGAPVVPSIPGLAELPRGVEDGIWTNREAVQAPRAPDSLVVLGGGTIGVELGQAFARFGSRVDIVERADRILALEEPEASAAVAASFAREGIGLHTSATVRRVERDGDRYVVGLGDRRLTADRLLVATGRRSDLDGLGVAAIGADPAARFLPTDGYLRAADGVYAIGDMVGHGAFTHMSMYQGAIVARHILGEPTWPADYRAVPRVTFTDPEVGATGLTEAQARAAGLVVRSAVDPLSNSTRGWLYQVGLDGEGADGLFKLVADAERGVLVGATAVGPQAGESIGLLTLAIQEAIPISRLARMIYAYPTFHRGISTALAALGG